MSTTEAAKVDPRRCTVDLSHFGEDNGTGSSSFSFTARDKNGDITSTASVFGAKIMNQQDGIESEIVVRRLEEEEGHYEVVFAPLNNGVYLVVLGILAPNKAFIQDMVKGSPFTVRVGPDPEQDSRIVPEPSKCYVFGPGAKKAAIKRKCSFVLQACGPTGEKARIGGDAFKVKVVPPAGGKLSSLPSSIQDQKDGTYTVSFTPTIPGEHVVHLTLIATDETHIANSPFSIPVLDAIDHGEEVDQSRTVIDLDHPVQLSNNVFGFPIAAKNAQGNPMRLSLQFRARITGPEGLDVQSKVVETENGSFLLKFVPKQSGKHDVDVDMCLNGTDQFAPVRGSPAILDLAVTFDEARIDKLQVLSKTPRDKTSESSYEKESPKWEPNRSHDAIPPRMALARESGAINRTPPPWSPPSSSSSPKAPIKTPPKNPLSTSGRRSFTSPPPVTGATKSSPAPSSPLASPPTSPPTSPPLKPGVPPKNPSSPLVSSSPPSWLVTKKPSTSVTAVISPK